MEPEVGHLGETCPSQKGGLSFSGPEMNPTTGTQSLTVWGASYTRRQPPGKSMGNAGVAARLRVYHLDQ